MHFSLTIVFFHDPKHSIMVNFFFLCTFSKNVQISKPITFWKSWKYNFFYGYIFFSRRQDYLPTKKRYWKKHNLTFKRGWIVRSRFFYSKHFKKKKLVTFEEGGGGILPILSSFHSTSFLCVTVSESLKFVWFQNIYIEIKYIFFVTEKSEFWKPKSVSLLELNFSLIRSGWITVLILSRWYHYFCCVINIEWSESLLTFSAEQYLTIFD